MKTPVPHSPAYENPSYVHRLLGAGNHPCRPDYLLRWLPRPEVSLPAKTAAVIASAVLLTGCLSPSAATIRALATDPATVKLNVRTPWGAMDFERANPTPAAPLEGYHTGNSELKVRTHPPR